MALLQAGALHFLSRYVEVKLTDAATLLGLEHPAVSVLVTAMVRNGWMSKRRSVKDTRACVCRSVSGGTRSPCNLSQGYAKSMPH
jgi:DNA-binding MarR family transcriptional regulator